MGVGVGREVRLACVAASTRAQLLHMQALRIGLAAAGGVGFGSFLSGWFSILTPTPYQNHHSPMPHKPATRYDTQAATAFSPSALYQPTNHHEALPVRASPTNKPSTNPPVT